MKTMRELREAKDATREEMAVAAGVSVDYIRRLEAGPGAKSGRCTPTVRIAQRIAAFLGVEVSDLWPITDNEPRRRKFGHTRCS